MSLRCAMVTCLTHGNCVRGLRKVESWTRGVHLHLSSSCFMAHKASTECFCFSRLAATVLTSFHNTHPASLLSFSTVHLQVVFIWSSSCSCSCSFFFWCPRHCYVAVAVLVLPSYMSIYAASLFTHRFHFCSF